MTFTQASKKTFSSSSRFPRFVLNLQKCFLISAVTIYAIIMCTQFKLANIIIGRHENSAFGVGVSSANAKARLLRNNEEYTQEELLALEFHQSTTSGYQQQTNVNLTEIATLIANKWNLTTSDRVYLLEKQFYKPYDYDPHKDFFHFHHLYKSGGTSISSLMDRTIGLPKVGKYYEGILPGSYGSGDFDHEEALEDINRRLAIGVKTEDLPYRASYAHTGLRPVYGPNRTTTGEFFLRHLPHKRLRVVTMLREPMDLRASNHAMIMCGLNYEVSRWNSERKQMGLDPACTPTEGLNISALVDRKVEDILKKCDEERQDPNKRHSPRQRQCDKEKKGEDTLQQCRSAADLLAHPQYDKHYRSMLKGVMGRFHRGQSFGGTAYGRMGYGYESAETSQGYSIEAVEKYTLEDLGGIDTSISGAGDGIGMPEPDFIWFGITERMIESTVLFHYYFQLRPVEKIPEQRVQDCRPTSWWTEEDRNIIKEREPADYAVWRAANAILDVRIERMKMEIKAKLQAGETQESLAYVDWDRLESI